MDDALAMARAAAKQASRWAYRTTYVGGAETISTHEPNAHTLHLTGLRSWNFAAHANCSNRTALTQLKMLANAGRIIQRPKSRYGAPYDFTLLPEEAITIGREIIAELRAEGLPFDDEWRAAGMPCTTTAAAATAAPST